MVTVTLPKHVAIIMDGNGRWAQARGYPRFYGHVRGAARVREIVTNARQLGIQAITLYAFSTENWKRPEEELSVLWGLLRKYIRREIKSMKENGIRLHVIGEIDRLPTEARNELLGAMEFLKACDKMHLTFALSYGGRAEILSAVRTLAEQVKSGKLTPGEIDESEFERHLWTAPLGSLSDVDFMIRTSGGTEAQQLSAVAMLLCGV